MNTYGPTPPKGSQARVSRRRGPDAMAAGVEAGRMEINKEGFVGHVWVQCEGAVVGMCTGERGGGGVWVVVP